MCISYKYYFSESEIVDTWNKTGVTARKNSFLAPDLGKKKNKNQKNELTTHPHTYKTGVGRGEVTFLNYEELKTPQEINLYQVSLKYPKR